MEKAQFKLDNFVFNKAELDFTKRKSSELVLKFTPNGKFFSGCNGVEGYTGFLLC